MFDVSGTFYVLASKTRDQRDSGSSLLVKASWLYGVRYTVEYFLEYTVNACVYSSQLLYSTFFSFWLVTRLKSIQPKHQRFLY